MSDFTLHSWPRKIKGQGMGLKKHPGEKPKPIKKESKAHRKTEKELDKSWEIYKTVMKSLHDYVFCLRCGTKDNLVPDHCLTRNQEHKHWPSKLQSLCWNCNTSKASIREDLREPKLIEMLKKFDPKGNDDGRELKD